MNRLTEALLAHGANINARVPETVHQWRGPARRGARTITAMPIGATAFFVATWSQNPALMRLLLAAGADPRLAADDGTTPLMAAAGVLGRPAGMRGKNGPPEAVEAVRIALENGGEIQAANAAGQTALHGAARMGLDPVVELLVEGGAKLDAADNNGDTPLALAKRAEAQSTVALMTRLTGERATQPAAGAARPKS
jgi:ankyrin repeat protein